MNHLDLHLALLQPKLLYYPNPLFWEQAAIEGCNVILGRDAHSPKHLLDTATEQRAMDLVRHFELNLVDTVALRKF